MVQNDIPRILIADDDRQMSRRLSDFLEERGFKCKTTNAAAECLELIDAWKPNFILYDLMLPGLIAMEFLRSVQRREIHLFDVPIMITSSHNAPENVKACIHAGAADFIVKPLSYQDVLARLAFHMQKKRQINAVSADTEKIGEYYLYLTELVLKKTASGKDSPMDLIFDLLQMQAMATKAVRCSLVETNYDLMIGTVRRSSDDRNFSGFQLQLQKYPEIMTVLKTEKLVAIDDLGGNPIMASVKLEFKNISFNSMVVCPVMCGNHVFGVVSARRQEFANRMSDAEIRFCQVISSIIGVILHLSGQESLAKAS